MRAVPQIASPALELDSAFPATFLKIIGYLTHQEADALLLMGTMIMLAQSASSVLLNVQSVPPQYNAQAADSDSISVRTAFATALV